MRLGLGLFFIAGIFLALASSAPASPTYGLAGREPVGPFFNHVLPPVAPGPSGAWTTVNAFPHLTFQDPTFLIAEPGANRLYVCGREGQIWSFDNDPDTTNKTLVLDLSRHTQGWDDCGLMSLAFHPEFGQPGSTNRGYIYVYYQYTPTNVLGSATVRPPPDIPAYNRLSRFTVPDGSRVADPNSELVLVNQFDRHLWHNGGAMFFGSDGFLYYTDGDEGGGNDTYNNTQRINHGLFSGVMRIDVNQDPAKGHPIRRQPLNGGPPPPGWPDSYTAHYYIPDDNPFVNPDGGVLEEFYALGVRSPHRMTYDSASGRIWLGDVGQDTREEIDIIERGGNYQWAYMEGFIPGPKPKPAHIIGDEKPPVYDYPHVSGNNCVIVGYVYRGGEFAADLQGKLIFGDNVSGRIWTLTYNGDNPPTVTYLCHMPPGAGYAGGLSSFGVDQNNEIYLCAMGQDGHIFKLARTGAATPEPPALLSQVGVFTNLSALAASPGLVPYDVNMPLWSDGAVKGRWLALPNSGATNSPAEQISFSPAGEWTFPAGTVFVKNFELPIDDTNPARRKRLETRLLVRDTNGAVYGVTYKWRADNSDADLLTNSLSEDIAIATTNGLTRTQAWYYPSRQDCLTCHNPNANYVLGVKTRQLNGNYTYAATGQTDNQLRVWNHLGMFNPPLNEADIPTYAALVNIRKADAPFEDRVRSYLDANCAQCHRPNGVETHWDARFDTPLANQTIVDGPVNNDFGIPSAKVVSSDSLFQSIMYLRMNTTGSKKMPPLARNTVDEAALAVLGEWIDTLTPNRLLPEPWDSVDVGDAIVPGNAAYEAGAFTLNGSGKDIGNKADAFLYAYQSMYGDGQIVARVADLDRSNTGMKAGVMIREALNPGSRHAFMDISSTNGTAFDRRASDGGPSRKTRGTPATAPCWIKLARSGRVFSSYDSNDGSKWHLVASDTIPMTRSVYVGLAVTAHGDGRLSPAVFDQVQVDNPPVIIAQPRSRTILAGTSVTFNVAAEGASLLNYQWRLNGADIPGATENAYLLGDTQPTSAGAYSVVVTNATGGAISASATLVVNVPPNAKR